MPASFLEENNLEKLAQESLENVRKKLLDLTGRNRLLNFRESKKTIRIVDELPDQVFDMLVGGGQSMELISYDPPKEEQIEGKALQESKQIKPLTSSEAKKYCEKYGLESEQVCFISERVEALGSFAAVQEQYSKKSPVAKFAHQYARTLYCSNLECDTDKQLDEVQDTCSIDLSNELPKDVAEQSEKHKDKFLQTPLIKKQLEKRCTQVTRDFKAAINETGANLLYMAIGFLEWTQADDSQKKFKAPLVLIPLEIEKRRVNRENELYAFEVAFSTEYIESNLSLAELLDKNFGLRLPEFAPGIKPEVYFEDVARVVEGKEGWKIHREMVIGFFSFSKLRIYKDLDESAWPKGKGPLDNQAIAELLVGRDKQDRNDSLWGEDPEPDDSNLVDQIPLVLDADGSQLSVINDVLFGNDNMVVHGPPGTGKSQTIANLIAAALSQKKTVLFVSEKKAALDVVRKRLNNVNLGDFCLELHSHQSRKGALHADLESRLKHSYSKSNGFDSKIKLRKYHRSRLVSYYDELMASRGNIGKSAYEILGEAEKWRTKVTSPDSDFVYDHALDLDQQTIDVTAEELEEFSRLFKKLPPEAVKAWSGFVPQVVLSEDERKVQFVLEDASEKTQGLLSKLKSSGIKADVSFGELRRFSNVNLEKLQSIPRPWMQDLGGVLEQAQGRDVIQRLIRELNEYNNLVNVCTSTFGVFEGIPFDNVEKAKNAAQHLKEMRVGSWSFGDLEKVHQLGKNFIQLRDELTRDTESVAGLYPGFVLNIIFCEKICELSDFLERLPPSFGLHIYDGHVSRLGLQYLEEATGDASNILEKKQKLTKLFVLEKAPGVHAIRALVNVFRNSPGMFGRLFSSSYKQAQKEFVAFRAKENQSKPLESIDDLECLIEFLDQAESFGKDENYTTLFGPKFIGIDTDWAKLENQVKATRKIAYLLGSEASAKKLLNDISRYQEMLRHVTECVRLKKGEMEKQLDVFGVRGFLRETSFDDFSQKIEQIEKGVADNLPRLLALNVSEKMTVTQFINAVGTFEKCISLKRNIEQNLRYKELLGNYFCGIETEIDPIAKMTEWTCSLVEDPSCGTRILRWLLKEHTPSRINTLVSIAHSSSAYLQALNEDFCSLKDLGPLNLNEWLGCDFAVCPVESALDKFQSALSQILYLQSWRVSQGLKKKLVDKGLTDIVEKVEDDHLDSAEASSFYRYAMFNSMARELVRGSKVLRDFQGAIYEQVRAQLQSIEQELEGLSQQKIAWAASQRRPPTGVSYGRVRDYTELSLIKHEIGKKRAHIPVRQLVMRSVSALKALKPCFMMSPMSVAQYLAPGAVTFDLVIMDEASQLKLEDALGVVMRGKQVVVVGDPKQLPPTSFFDKNIEISSDDETISDNAESILDVAQNCFPNNRLRWHYRSEDERLIAFSNAQFYHGDLVVFPTPNKTGVDTGVFHHYIENSYSQKGTKGGVVNRLEATTVAEAIRTHFRKYGDLSLGVATFNASQCELIQDELDRLCRSDKWLEDKIKKWDDTPDSFFIKNLENVQGDERDVIFISTTYGPDKQSGQVFQRFGPINSATGWRRLNVIVTRAKKQVHVFTALRSTDIKVTSSSKEGVVALRNYLEFVETGRIPEWGEVNPDRGPDSDFEIAVAYALNQRGYKTAYQVGVAGFFIDIGVYHPQHEGEFILGIECDGATYHSAKSVRDRDILRQSILESKGWNIHRIWSTDWFKSRDNEITRLMDKLDELVAKSTVVQSATITEDIPGQRYKPQKDIVATSGDSEDEELRHALFEFRENKIKPEYEDVCQTILSDIWIERFVERKPTSRAEFSDFPLKDRETILGGTEYLNDILNLIEDFV
ncbi:DUF4011 domain-containing protein [Desulfobaculum bizertense]|uniref:AAA domain-containing protein n=1 Tax=Desulfobaculum bizertense DSM 18034 TaxID=1121442 RepID=A0A1T4VSE9_9BACT|nr:DUF4011 domain-containing protein [Desulfobaculum bizertense]SKA67886.1 AAA domain-containing protein [Desulfobaculum bizertense DSM 18034]